MGAGTGVRSEPAQVFVRAFAAPSGALSLPMAAMSLATSATKAASSTPSAPAALATRITAAFTAYAAGAAAACGATGLAADGEAAPAEELELTSARGGGASE